MEGQVDKREGKSVKSEINGEEIRKDGRKNVGG